MPTLNGYVTDDEGMIHDPLTDTEGMQLEPGNYSLLWRGAGGASLSLRFSVPQNVVGPLDLKDRITDVLPYTQPIHPSYVPKAEANSPWRWHAGFWWYYELATELWYPLIMAIRDGVPMFVPGEGIPSLGAGSVLIPPWNESPRTNVTYNEVFLKSPTTGTTLRVFVNEQGVLDSSPVEE
jgi:hypothetical protein